jgi:hypothetical protein
MKSIKILLLLFLLFSFSLTLMSQDSIKVLDQVYGLDQTLYNGKKYNYYLPIGTKGHQYLVAPVYIAGSLTLKEKCYQDINLNYDIFNQQLLLKYNDENGATNIIEVSKAWIKSFRLGNMKFEYLSLEKNPRYYQVLGEGEVRLLYYWRKSFDLEGSIGSYYYTFSKPVRDSFVLKDGQLKPFNTNQGFIRIFGHEQRPEIKSYMHKNKVRVKKASDQTMSDVINFIENLK